MVTLFKKFSFLPLLWALVSLPAFAMDDGKVRCPNRNLPFSPLKAESSDYLYHLGVLINASNIQALKEQFGSLRYVVMAGENSRATTIATEFAEKLGLPIPQKIFADNRYYFYHVGQVLIASHGMGQASLSILLNEVSKLLHYVEAKNVTYIRVGTSGGIGVSPGSIIVSKSYIDPETKEPTYRKVVCGKPHFYLAHFDPDLAQEIFDFASRRTNRVALGNTTACDDFYEGQGRLDGALCDHAASELWVFLNQLRAEGALNIEMEAGELAYHVNRMNHDYRGKLTGASLRAADVCVTFLNRLHGDQVTATPEQLMEWKKEVISIVVDFVIEKLRTPIED